MRQICSSQRISTEILDYIIEDHDHAGAGWSGKTVESENGKEKPKIILQKMQLHLKPKRFPSQLTSYMPNHRYHTAIHLQYLTH
ncbi:phage major capsid protein, HK97 family [Wolbachia endosymbiont of Wuchereria bancrofti]|nr:phage major capsid protein, HK97 family [Wolbachia endosymbiont of Wuchereria bancrofti]